MGLPMNNLHAPTIPSGPTSGPQGENSALDRLSLMELISKKDNLEAELKALGSVLDSVSHLRLDQTL
jgi:26S proteasome non-ATPase regulatory subunit 9